MRTKEANTARLPAGRQMALLISGVVVLAVLVMQINRALGIREMFMPLVTVASTAYVVIALLNGALRSGFGRFVLLGLLFCFAGDMIGPRRFELGSLMFLLAHVGFSAAFLGAGFRVRLLIPAAVAALLAAAMLTAWLYPAIPRSQLSLIVGYSVVISAMVALAIATRAADFSPLLRTAAVLFYISDVFVALWTYTPNGSIYAMFCYPLYYAACVLLAFVAGIRLPDEDAAVA